MTGSGVGVGAGGSGVREGVGVAAGGGVGVAFMVTVMVALGSVSDCFGAGVGSAAVGGSEGSVPCVSVSSTLEVDAYELSCISWGEVV